MYSTSRSREVSLLLDYSPRRVPLACSPLGNPPDPAGTAIAESLAMSIQPTSLASRRALVCAALVLTGFFGGSSAWAQAASNQPEGWDSELRLKEAVDINPDPKIVEVNIDARVERITIAPGKTVEAFTYNGQVPGPLIRLNVGDRLIVHFTNHLPMATTIHWHGVRVPIEMDGVPGISQPEVKPGGAFTYDLMVPDPGLFWYHPHVAYAEQVGFGLYAPLVVEDPAEKSRLGVVDEIVVVLSDIGIDENGKLEDPESGGTTGMAFGREGNIVLVNGKVGGMGTLKARSGAPMRWRILNAAKSRYFSLDLDGQPLVKIGSDGGLIEYQTTATSLVLGCAERVDLIVQPKGSAGGELLLHSFVFNRGYGSVEFRPAEEPLFKIQFADGPAYSGPAPTRSTRAITPYSAEGATPLELLLTIDQLQDGRFQYGIDHKPYWTAKAFTAKLGETQIWTITNKTPWSHPFHLHGFFFHVVDEKGQAVHPIEWKDTVNVQFDQTVRVLVRFDERPGTWMMHCHILDHADGGLMGTIRVGLPDDPHATHLPHPHDYRF